VPELIALQDRYGAQGLEVIGITYEQEGAPQEQAVKAFRSQAGVNYRMLLGTNAETCPVKKEFRIASFPTLVLLDGQGNILWRAEGFDEARGRQLEAEIRSRLSGP
jgi:hypothetical protein